jgi:hypothetical protein
MGSQLVRRQRIGTCALIVLAAACKEVAKLPMKTAEAVREPQVRATVVTLQTTLQPQNKTFIHVLAIAEGRARTSEEVDSWRLIDLNRNSVTFVDDVAKTYRTESFAALFAARRAAMAETLPDGMPRAKVAATGVKRTIRGIVTSQLAVRLGAYQRDLWIGNHPALPPQLFTIMSLTQPVTTPLAPTMKALDDALLNLRGFALEDHAELPYGSTKMIVDTMVLKIEHRDVPQSWLNVNANYRDVTARAARPRSASSLPLGRTIQGVESRLFGTAQKTP